MANLEKLLLEAAGRTSASGRNRRLPPAARRQNNGSNSDDGSDSKDDSDDFVYVRRKRSGPQVPLNRRLDHKESDDGSSQEEGHGYNDEGDSDGDSVGSDLYKDEDDRKKLAEMSELEREMILEDRASKKADRAMQQKMRRQNQKMPRLKKGSPPRTLARRVRSSARFADRAAAKDEALNELRTKRLRQQDPETRQKQRDAALEGSGNRTFPSRRGFTAATISCSSTSESGSHSGDAGDSATDDSDEEKSPESQVITLDEIKEITIGRSKLIKWHMEPFFDELMEGCFVRLGIGMSKSGGPVYRLCMVQNVDSTDPDRPYRLENKFTLKYLNVTCGNENYTARWQMTRVSNSPPLKAEFDYWVREVERSGGRVMSKQDVLEKKEAIKKTNSFVYSAAMVKQMLQEKKSTNRRPLNIAAEKDRLRREMEVAQMNHDEAEVESVKARLQELEASRQSQEKDSKAIRLAEMNRKNRAENFKNASELKPVNTGLKAGEAGYDPFSRRWTRSRNYYVSNPSGGDEGAKSANGECAAARGFANSNGEGEGGGTGAGVTGEAGRAATAAALEAASDAGKLVDTSAPVDQVTESNTLHDFELPISLAALHKFGGTQGLQAGFMAQKQRIEATVGYQVPEDDGRRHALTLTVGDYKRRRGLL